jgi:hypothetical protein
MVGRVAECRQRDRLLHCQRQRRRQQRQRDLREWRVPLLPYVVNLKITPPRAACKGIVLSVLLKDRGISRMEFWHTARDLREDITNLLLRDFGVKDKVRTEIVDGSKSVTIIEEYPEWLIAYFRKNMLDILRNLMKHITSANTIYPVNEYELNIQRHYKTMAITACEDLLQEMEFIADLLPVKLAKFLPYADRIEKEIALLKGWRKSSNKLRNTKGGKKENK